MTRSPRGRLAALCPALATLALAASACGSSDEALDPDLGGRLAAQSDLVAASLARGDDCAARRAARGLRRDAERAIVAGRVPTTLARQLRLRTTRLADSIVCVPPAKPVAPAHDAGHGDEDGTEDEDD